VIGIRASARPNKQKAVHLTHVLMMVLMLCAPVRQSGTMTKHGPNRCILETMQGDMKSEPAQRLFLGGLGLFEMQSVESRHIC
jgi:hypothetical protein